MTNLTAIVPPISEPAPLRVLEPEQLSSANFVKPAPKLISVLVVDDHPFIRIGLKMRLSIEPDMQVIGEADSGMLALERAAQLRPDVILMDVVMPDMSGIQTATHLHKLFPATKIVLMSLFDNEIMHQEARRAGATHLIAKQGTSDPLVEAIRGKIKPEPPSATTTQVLMLAPPQPHIAT